MEKRNKQNEKNMAQNPGSLKNTKNRRTTALAFPQKAATGQNWPLLTHLPSQVAIEFEGVLLLVAKLYNDRVRLHEGHVVTIFEDTSFQICQERLHTLLGCAKKNSKRKIIQIIPKSLKV